VHVVASGLVASMGIVILLSAHQRSMHLNATLMIHEISSTSVRTPTNQLRSTIKHVEALQERMYKLILDRSRVSEDVLRRAATEELWLLPEQALELGLVDAII
jgi:ATP-dependent protease ClpP protease subunit